MLAILSRLPIVQKAALILGGFLIYAGLIVWGVAGIYNAGGDARGAKILFKIEKERAEILDRTNKIIQDSQNKLRKIEDEVERDAKNDDLTIGRALRNQLKRMRHNQD